MAKTAHYYTKFEYNCFYHIYNRTVDEKPMFRSRENYRYFLQQYQKYLGEVIDTFAYNLLGNHFHLLIRIPDENEIQIFKNENGINPEWDVHKIVSHQFKKFFQSYAMSFNKQHQRIGTLFQTPFKRAFIDNQKYLLNTITYIHQNAQHHGLVDDFRDWEWCSFHSLVSEKETKLKREQLMGYFGGRNGFKYQHHNTIDGISISKIEG